MIGDVDVDAVVATRDLFGDHLEAVTGAAGSALQKPELLSRLRSLSEETLHEEGDLLPIRRVPIERDFDVRALGTRIVAERVERARRELDRFGWWCARRS